MRIIVYLGSMVGLPMSWKQPLIAGLSQSARDPDEALLALCRDDFDKLA